ncbi:hypothetical protein ABZ746_23735 [Streptomyces sp. NPDC020096]
MNEANSLAQRRKPFLSLSIGGLTIVLENKPRKLTTVAATTITVLTTIVTIRYGS